MTTKELLGNKNYAAVVVSVPEPYNLEGLDNLEGYGILGSQILSQRQEGRTGSLSVYFGAETRLSHEYASANNLYRKAELNTDPTETGYLEENRRVRAIKLRKHRSDALLMPLESLTVFGADPLDFQEGDTFDHVNGHEVCRKHVVQAPPASKAERKVAKAFRRVTDIQFPMHLDTDNYWRNRDQVKLNRITVVTQKLHGTSGRFGRVPVLRKKKWAERALNRLGVQTPDYQYDNVYGSRKVIKGEDGKEYTHYYTTDVWGEVAQELIDRIPDGYVIYGEIIGWTSDGSPIQPNYTYDLPKGEHALYVYRVAVVNASGDMADLSWEGVKEFCRLRGLEVVPEVGQSVLFEDNVAGVAINDFHEVIENLMDRRYADEPGGDVFVPLSDKKTVDEGVCIRQDGIVPNILKAKSPVFLGYETKLLDEQTLDLESAN